MPDPFYERLFFGVAAMIVIVLAGPVLAVEEPAAPRSEATSVDMSIAAARAAIEAGDGQLAFEKLDRLLSVDTVAIQSATVSVLYGHGYVLIGEPEFAIDFYTDAIDGAVADQIARSDEFDEILDGIARFLMRQGNIPLLAEVAAITYENGLSFDNVMIDPDNFDLILSDPFAIVPNEVADFSRRQVRFYQSGWLDLSFRYSLAGSNTSLIDLYFSKYGADYEAEHFESAKGDIYGIYNSVELLSEEMDFRTGDAEVPAGNYASFRFERSDVLHASELLLIVVDDWHLKLRASYPWDGRDKGRVQVADFIEQFPWPIPAVIPLPIAEADGAGCPAWVDRDGPSRAVPSAAAALGMGLTYITYARGDAPIPVIKPDEFCVAQKFKSYGQTVVAYSRFKNGAIAEEGEVEPSDVVLHRFSVNAGQEYMEVSTSLLLDELIANEPDQVISDQAVQITYFGQYATYLMGLFDGVPAQQTLARMVSEMIAGQFDPMVSVNIAEATAP